MKRIASLVAAAGALAVVAGLMPAGGAAAGTSLPTLNVALTGTQGISVSGSTVSGAVKVVTTLKGQGHGEVGLVRLRHAVTLQQALQAVNRHHGDLNALTPYGKLFVDASAPSTVQTVFQPGNYVALNITGHGQPGIAQFKVTKSSSPAALPAAKATESAIEFGFRGPRKLKDHSMVRARNRGWLVHMIELNGVRNARAGRHAVRLLRAGKERHARHLITHQFVNLLGPASPGALQQQVLRTKPGYYVEVCFMDTQDGREHAQIGMARLVHVVR